MFKASGWETNEGSDMSGVRSLKQGPASQFSDSLVLISVCLVVKPWPVDKGTILQTNQLLKSKCLCETESCWFLFNTTTSRKAAIDLCLIIVPHPDTANSSILAFENQR